MLAYMFFPTMALLIGGYTLRAAGHKGLLARVYGTTLVLVGLAMAGGLISAEVADASPHEASVLVSLR